MTATKVCPQCGATYEADIKFCPLDGSALRGEKGASLIGQVIADRYLITAKLGEGGMGQVFLAEHVKMGRKSAIKVMTPSMMSDAEAVGRFNREAAHASRINHPNVAAIYDFGETRDGLIYLAMEYVEGEPLTRIMERQGALPVARAADIARQVALALDAAHELGIVHRDLKPDNIMIAAGRGGADIVKVVDFGIAKREQEGGRKVTRTGLIVGTPEYMSPEQAAGDELDGRSDTYALALVTFHMLAGTLPFASATIQQSLLMRLTERPRTLSEVRPDVDWPPALQAVLDRALARLPYGRYPRSIDFSADLIRALVGSPAVQNASDASAPSIGDTSVSLPPTRVRPGVEPPATPSGATTVVRPAVSRPTAPPMPTLELDAPRGRGRRAMLAVGGAIVLASAAFAYNRARPPETTAGRTPALDTPLARAPRTGRRMNPGAAGTAAPGSKRVAKGTPTDSPATRIADAATPSVSAVDTAIKGDALERDDSALVAPSLGPLGSRRPSTLPFTATESRTYLNVAGRQIENAVFRENRRRLQQLAAVLSANLGRFSTRADSAEALYHIGEALIAHGNFVRGCDLMRKLQADPKWANGAAYLVRTQCQ